MKTALVTILTFFSFATLAQCDNSFFPFKEGTSFEQTNYNQKDKVQGRTVSTVTSIENNEATVVNMLYDKKGELLTEASYKIICDGNSIKFDFQSFVPEGTFSQYGDATVTVEGDFITVPNELTVGAVLPDGSGKITVDMANMQMNMNMTLTQRNVEKKETLTTEAGSFECYKVSQNTAVTVNMMGMKKTTETRSASWFARGVGMVRTENYDRKGNLMGYSVLTDFQSN